MDYISVQEAAKRWKISERMVRLYCTENRVSNAEYRNGNWYIPKNARKPKREAAQKTELRGLAKKVVYQKVRNNHFGIYELEPMHIAEDGSSIQILQAINMVKGTAVVGQPKSRDSYRVIPVPPGLYECAKALRTTDKKYIWEEGKKDTPCNPSHFRKKYKEAISAVEGVRYLTPHSCRHTYVSQMQAIGVPMETIQSLVGHADPSMTEHYLHVQEQIRKQAAEKYSDTFCAE